MSNVTSTYQSIFKKTMGSIWTRIKAKWNSRPCKGGLLCILPIIWENEATYTFWEAASVMGVYDRVSP